MKPILNTLKDYLAQFNFVRTKTIVFMVLTLIFIFAFSLLFLGKINSARVIGLFLYITTIFIVSLLLLKGPFKNNNLKEKDIYLIQVFSIFFIILVFVTAIILDPIEVDIFTIILPISLITLLLTILISLRTAIICTFFFSLLLFTVDGCSFNAYVFTFLAGINGAFIAIGTQKRIHLLRNSLLLGIILFFIVMILGLLNNKAFNWFIIFSGIAFLNGIFSGILALGILPIFEQSLNVATPFRLIELSDLNTPLFKRMLTLAPGTYGHSVNVANLAESAAQEIGANTLLSRVGGYYHDIGKIDQAEYFIENQSDTNKHDDLKPSLSVAVIKSHVKIGLEKAKELKLPNEILEIIEGHHGNGLISFFYMQALKEEKNTKVKKEDFSYNGTPPTSKESAVIMLADSVEAATRTLKKPSVSKLEKFIWDIIMEKFNSGQLNKSNLTFQDLEKIKQTFVHILAGQFHSRIEYPEMNK